MIDRYTLRHAKNGKHIDIVHADTPKGEIVVRVPVHLYWRHKAEDTADLVCRLLNDHARVIHQEEP